MQISPLRTSVPITSVRAGNIEDEGYTLIKDFSKITQVSALEAMLKFYTRDIAELKLLGKKIPTNLAQNLEGAQKRAIELGHNPQELLNKPNPLLSLAQPTVEDLYQFYKFRACLW